MLAILRHETNWVHQNVLTNYQLIASASYSLAVLMPVCNPNLALSRHKFFTSCKNPFRQFLKALKMAHFVKYKDSIDI